MPSEPWSNLALRLGSVLQLEPPPVAITFSADRPGGVSAFDAVMPPPLADGRTGRVPAGCVFWMEAVDRSFSTVAEDHANCSVGSMTHGFKKLDEVAGNSDIATMLQVGWVTEDMIPRIPVVSDAPGAVTYGPLAETSVDPDVVLLRVNAEQLMMISDASPGLQIGGKPQCHIVAVAKEGQLAASVGCASSRARTGMSRHEMTCAVPAGQLASLVDALEAAVQADNAVAGYAAVDARRFA